MNRPARVILGGVALVVVAAALGVFAWLARPGGRAVYTDGAAIRVPASGAPLRSILWEPAKPIDGPINSTEQEYEPRLTLDGQTLYFVRGKAGHNADLYVSTRTPTGWSEPQPLPFNTPDDELGPSPSPDGQSLYFYSNRPGGLGGYDLWVARRDGDSWHEPENLGPGVNTEFNEYSPAPSPDGSRLYFASNRPRPGEKPESAPALWPATIRESRGGHDYDLFAAPLNAGMPGKAEALVALNTTANEGTPAVSPFGDFLYFSSDRPGGAGGFDLWRARLAKGMPREPENLGTAINSAYDDLDPSLSMGGFAIHFSSDRPRQVAAGGDYNIYTSNSHEVYREAGETDWAGFFSLLGPRLLWLLLSLLALLALLWLMKGARGRKLSLLMQCLLASLMVHAAIMFMLNFWKVAGAAGQYFGNPGSRQVHLTLTGGGVDALAGQIRGESSSSSDISLPSGGTVTAPLAMSAPTKQSIEVSAAPVSPTVSSDVSSDAREAAPIAEAVKRVEAPESASAAVSLPAAAAPSAAPERSADVALASRSEVSPRQSVAGSRVSAPSGAAPGRVNAGILATGEVREAAGSNGLPGAPAPVAQGSDAAVALPATPAAGAVTEARPDVVVNRGAGNAAPAAPVVSAAPAVVAASVGTTAAPVAVPKGESLAGGAVMDSDARGSGAAPAMPALGGEGAASEEVAVALPAAGAPARVGESEPGVRIGESVRSPALAGPVPRVAAARGAPSGGAAPAASAISGSLAGGSPGAAVRDAGSDAASSAVGGMAPAAPVGGGVSEVKLPAETSVAAPPREIGNGERGGEAGREKTVDVGSEVGARRSVAPPVGVRGPAPTPGSAPMPVPVAVAPLSQMDAAGGEIADAPSTVRAETPPAPGAVFFGLTASGKRFAYICDVSGSMDKRVAGTDRRRIDILKTELMSSVQGLGAEAKFFVCLFSDDAVVVGDRVEWHDADGDGKKWARDHVREIEAGGDTIPLRAFRVALSMDPKPDAIYFMTDGEFDRGYVREIARLNRELHIPIHCITFVSRRGDRAMQQIADESGGSFTHVDGVESY